MQTAVRERKEGNKHRFKRAKNLNKGLSQEGTTDRQTDRQTEEGKRDAAHYILPSAVEDSPEEREERQRKREEG